MLPAAPAVAVAVTSHKLVTGCIGWCLWLTGAVAVAGVLPEDRAAPAAGLGFAVYPFAEAARGFVHMAPLRAAIRSRRKVEITYAAPDSPLTPRTVRPLQMEYWGRVWTLTGWCELRNDFSGQSPPITLEKGAEVGRFKLGSTVILLFGPDAVELENTIQPDNTIKLGEALAAPADRNSHGPE